MLFAEKKVTLLYNEDILAEYRDVLSRKKFNIPKNTINKLINFFRQSGINSHRQDANIVMPDESDRVFYEISLSKEDSFLVTGNLKHFPASPQIISPADFVCFIECDAKGD